MRGGEIVCRPAGYRPRMTTPAHQPPMAASNEAEPDQLDVARAEGDAYGRALKAMDQESGAVTGRAGDYLVAFVQEEAEGMWGPDRDGRLVWHESPEEANAHLEVAVADAGDGRFVPGLVVTLTVSTEDGELFSTSAPFLWHPFLHHYGTNAVVPDEGPYTVTVRIAAPGWMRHDPINGNRYSEPVEIVFADQRFDPGRKPSPDAQPRGSATGVARPTTEAVLADRRPEGQLT